METRQFWEHKRSKTQTWDDGSSVHLLVTSAFVNTETQTWGLWCEMRVSLGEGVGRVQACACACARTPVCTVQGPPDCLCHLRDTRMPTSSKMSELCTALPLKGHGQRVTGSPTSRSEGCEFSLLLQTTKELDYECRLLRVPRHNSIQRLTLEKGHGAQGVPSPLWSVGPLLPVNRGGGGQDHVCATPPSPWSCLLALNSVSGSHVTGATWTEQLRSRSPVYLACFVMQPSNLAARSPHLGMGAPGAPPHEKQDRRPCLGVGGPRVSLL